MLPINRKRATIDVFLINCSMKSVMWMLIFVLVILCCIAAYFLFERQSSDERDNNKIGIGYTTHTEPMAIVSSSSFTPQVDSQIVGGTLENKLTAMTVTSEALIGDWQVENSFYESITMNLDGTYVTYLYNKLLTDGTWQINADGSLMLVSPFENVPGETFLKFEVEGETVVLTGSDGIVTWRKM